MTNHYTDVCEATIESLRKTIERQAAQIEMMRDLIPKRIPDGFVSFGKYCCEQESLFNPSYNVMTPHKKRYLSDCEEALATPDQALEQFAAIRVITELPKGELK